jgi:hypothetical protein
MPRGVYIRNKNKTPAAVAVVNSGFAYARRAMQDMLDAMSNSLYNGGNQMCQLETVINSPAMYPPVLLAIATACPPEERTRLWIRSGNGECSPHDRHPGQQEKVELNSEPSKPIITPLMTMPKKWGYGERSEEVIRLVGQASSEGLTNCSLAKKLLISSSCASGLLAYLHTKKLLQRKENIGHSPTEPHYIYYSTSDSESLQ